MAPVVAPVSYASLEEVATQARPYPDVWDVDSALVLFGAAFLGHNDAIWYALAGATCDVVDVDGARLAEMRALYPDAWRFHKRDAWSYGDEVWAAGFSWDAVSLDPFTGDAMSRAIASLDLWVALARRRVVCGVAAGVPYVVPRGWRSRLLERSSGVYWLVLERAP